MRSHCLLFLFVLLCCNPSLFAQGSAKKVKLQDFKVNTDNIDPQGRKGIKLQFDVHFNWVNEVRKENMFMLTWRVEDAAGQVVHRSKEQKDYTDSKMRIIGSTAYKDRNPPYMLARYKYLYLPFEFLGLSSGPQKLTVVFSLENEVFQFPDFYRKEVQFQYNKIEEQPFSAQEFAVEDLQFSHNKSGFGVKEPGLDISFRLRPRYGQKESESTSYKVYWVLRDLQKKVVFDSRKSASIHHRGEVVSFRNMEGDRFRKSTCFSRYNDILLPGPGKLELILLAEDESKEKKEIYKAVHAVDLPVKYKFSSQKFKVHDLESNITTRKGVQGLQMNFGLEFEKIGPRLDMGLGDYFVYLEIRDAGGNVIFSPEKLEHDQFSSAVLAYACNAYTDDVPVEIELFVPWYKMGLAAGKTHLQYSLRVADQARTVRFPELSKGGRVATAPRLRKYEVKLDVLRMVEGDYDVEFLKTGSHLPDLQWTLQVGRDDQYKSKQINNTLSAPTGTARVTVAEGDVLSLVLYDIDSGIFNRNDWLGRWEIPFMAHNGEFVFQKDSEGQLAKLQVQVTPMK